MTLSLPSLSYFLGLSAVLFMIGFLGFILRRSAIMIFMSLELMFNAANLVFVTFAAYYQTMNAQVYVFFVIAVAAVEVAIGLALIVGLYRNKNTIDIDRVNSLKDPQQGEGYESN